VNNVKLEPVLVSNLAYFDVPANQFVTGGIEEPFFLMYQLQTYLLKNFSDKLRVDLFFEVSNTINRGYTIDLVF
jgi:hypothetical protein